jgi:hypothetical protein
MENINGKSRARFPWTFSCAVTMGLAVSVSLCFAQGNRDASQELQRFREMTRLMTAPPEKAKPLVCDSLAPEVCFEIYQRRMEHTAGADEAPAGDYRCRVSDFAPSWQRSEKTFNGTFPPPRCLPR